MGEPWRRRVALHSRRDSEEWPTPRSFFDALDAEFHFTLDPCATPENAKCTRYFTKDDNGLDRRWEGVVFVNPPFRDCDAWVAKAWRESCRGATVVCLVPSRTDTEWWHRYAPRAEIRWIRGRLRFNTKASAPFPCCLLIFHGGTHGS